MAKFNKNWMKQLSESYIWEMQQSNFPPSLPPQPQPAPQPAPEPYNTNPFSSEIPPGQPPQMGRANNGKRGDQRKPVGRGGRTTNSERGPRNPPVLPPPPNVNWANLWRQYSGSGYNNETLQGLYLQARRAGFTGEFGQFYAILFAQYGGNQFQEQNYNLRNKARWLMEAAASSNVSMLQPTVQNEPMGQYTGANPNSTYTALRQDALPQPGLKPGIIPGPDKLKVGEKYTFKDQATGERVSYVWNGSYLIVTVILPDGSKQILVYEWWPENGIWYPLG